jgi:3-isopropylmalate dehydrogenase
MNKSYNVAVIPGGITGPEVVREGRKVLNAAAAKYGFKISFEEFDFGGERYLRTGEILPDSAQEQLKRFDFNIPWCNRASRCKNRVFWKKGLLLRLRFVLDQYINLRPVKLYPGWPHR